MNTVIFAKLFYIRIKRYTSRCYNFWRTNNISLTALFKQNGGEDRKTNKEERKIIVKLHNQYKSLWEIAQLVDNPQSTIQLIIDPFYKRKTVKNKWLRDLSETNKPRFIKTSNKDRFKNKCPQNYDTQKSRCTYFY